MKIRLWKLGNIEQRIQAGPAAFVKLREGLKGLSLDQEFVDLIWDDCLTVTVIDVNEINPVVAPKEVDLIMPMEKVQVKSEAQLREIIAGALKDAFPC